MRLRCVGIDVLPRPHDDVDMDRELALWRRLPTDASTGDRPWTPLRPPAVAILADENGDEYVLETGDTEPMLHPWIRGGTFELADDGRANSGVVSVEAARSWRSATAGGIAQLESIRRKIMALILDLRCDNGAGPVRPSSRRSAGAVHAGPASAPRPAEEANSEPSPKEPDLGDVLVDSLPTIGAQQLLSLAANAWVDGALRPSALLSGALGSLASTAALFGLNKLMGDGPDDSSSTAEWALSKLGPQLVGKFIGMGNPGRYFAFDDWHSPYASPALRKTDVDDNQNAILEGFGSVFIEGLPAARDTDPVDKSGVKCVFGAKTTLIGNQHAARVDKPSGYGTSSLAAPFSRGASRTLIGGPTTNPSPPPPAELQTWADANANITGDKQCRQLPTIGPEGPQPNQPGLWFDPELGEWRIWDGVGVGATLSEYANLPDWGLFGIRDIFQAEDGHWYLFGGAIDLGSPKFPGAGTGGTWFVPDIIFGIDMGPAIYSLHDRIFDPSNPKYAFEPWKIFSEWEGPAFFQGFTWNPLQWILKVIYSTATTTASLILWWQSFLEAIDEAVGLPDRYGHTPHLRHDSYKVAHRS